MKFELPIIKIEDKIKDFLMEIDLSEERIEELQNRIDELTDSIIEDIKFNVAFIIEES
jgi:peptidoglycan hydrolase CwlO-like protein